MGQPKSLALPDFLDADVAGSSCEALRLESERRGQLLANKENLAPNVYASLVVDRPKRTRRVKKAAARPPAQRTSAAAATAATAAAPAEAVPAESSRSASPAPMTRAYKQQKLTGGEAAILARCPALSSDQTSNVSPPLGRVTERHIAFALRAKATRVRGPSSLKVCCAACGPRSEVDRLTTGVACCELME